MTPGFATITPDWVVVRAEGFMTSAAASRSSRLLLVIAFDFVLAGATSAAVFGHGWCWPPSADLTAVIVGALVHPATPAAGWPTSLASRLPTAAAYWCAFFVLATDHLRTGSHSG